MCCKEQVREHRVYFYNECAEIYIYYSNRNICVWHNYNLIIQLFVFKLISDVLQASKQSEDMTGVIVGVTIGMSILLIGLISALTFFLIKRR